jgi:hypothetical protein
MATLFFSYSHKDEELRDRLEAHLAMLKRQGLITTWHDRRITAGQRLSKTIDQNLESADIILLLVSADFLHSDYCYGIEVQHAMDRHERGEATVVPIILRPCDWKTASFGHLLAVPRDGRPVISWPNPDEAFLDVANTIRAELARRERQQGSPPPTRRTPSAGTPTSSGIRSSNLKIPHAFSEREKDDFLEEAFGYIATFFENSLLELERQNPGAETKYRRLDANRFTAIIYRGGRAVARCTIWMGSRSGLVGGIAYSENDSGETNSFNESLSVEADQESLYLKPLGMAFVGQGRTPDRMTVQVAADYIWSLLLRRLRERL